MEGLQSWVTNHQFTNIGTIWATIVATSMAYTSAKRDAFKPNVRYTSCIEAFKQFIFISMVILYVFVCHYRMHALGLTLVDQLSVEFKPIRVYSYIEWWMNWRKLFLRQLETPLNMESINPNLKEDLNGQEPL